jgi:DDE family transposase
MYHHTSVSPKGAALSYDSIPAFARFQWINSAQVVDALSLFLKPGKQGRKGYGPVLLFRWLMWKWLMRSSYRDLESMSGIDYSTFIKFRKRLIASFLLPKIFKALARGLVADAKDLRLIIDSSFVATYSGHGEAGSEYSGYKKANGFKLHSAIDYRTRLPVSQLMTGGPRSDVRIAHRIIERAPPRWKVRSLTADKGYDSEAFVSAIKRKWRKARVGIPLRKTNQEKRQDTTKDSSTAGSNGCRGHGTGSCSRAAPRSSGTFRGRNTSPALVKNAHGDSKTSRPTATSHQSWSTWNTSPVCSYYSPSSRAVC